MDEHLGFGSVSASDGTLVVPPEVRRRLGLDNPDAVVEFAVRGGEVVLLPKIAVHPDDAWFCEEGQQRAEQEVEDELATDVDREPMTGAEFLAHLERLDEDS